MNPLIRIVILLFIIASSTTVFAQKVNPSLLTEPVKKEYSGLRSAQLDTNFRLNFTLRKPDNFPFSYQFPAIALNDDQVIGLPTERPIHQSYNMPIVRPEKTSKILIAKQDPHSPYSYTMPILKNESAEE
jgi:hypothetical protein